MEGEIKIKKNGAFFWSTRYGLIIEGGEFAYFSDSTKANKRFSVKLKDYQIVQVRANHIIKLVSAAHITPAQQVQIKTDLDLLWYQKLLQAKVASMDIRPIPLAEAQAFSEAERARGVQSNPQINQRSLQQNEQQQEYPQVSWPSSNSYQQQQQQQLEFPQRTQLRQQQQQQQQQIRQQNLHPQQQFYQQPQQQTQPIFQAAISAAARSGLSNEQNSARFNNNNSNAQVSQEVRNVPSEKKEGFLNKIFGVFQKAPLYSRHFVDELNTDLAKRALVESRIDSFMLPFIPQMFEKYEAHSNVIINSQQHMEMVNFRNSKIGLDQIQRFKACILLICVILLNLLNWQANLITFTAISLIVVQIINCFDILDLEKAQHNIHACTTVPLQIRNSYTIEELLIALKLANPNLCIIEQKKEVQLVILDKNPQFQAVFNISIESNSKFAISVFTYNLNYMGSILDNLTRFYSTKQGIWHPKPCPIEQRRVFDYSDAISQIKQKFKTNVVKESEELQVSFGFALVRRIAMHHWGLIYEIFALFFIWNRMVKEAALNSNEIIKHASINESEISSDTLGMYNYLPFNGFFTWFLCWIYSATYVNLTYEIQEFFLSVRDDLQKIQVNYDTATQKYAVKPDLLSNSQGNNNNIRQKKSIMASMEIAVVAWLLILSLLIFGDFEKIGSMMLLPLLKLHNLTSESYKTAVAGILVVIRRVPRYCIGQFISISRQIARYVKEIITLVSSEIANRTRTTHSNVEVVRNRSVRYIRCFHADTVENYQEMECSICMEMYTSPTEDLFKCSNKHFFHKDCIVRWIHSGNFSSTKNCPICRVSLF